LAERIRAKPIGESRLTDELEREAIKNCDSKTSKKLARRTVTSALDCIHLMFGAEHTDKMRIGGPRLEHDKRASLEIGANGKLNPGFSIGGPGQVGFREGWSAVLQHARYEQSAELIGIALESAVDPDLVRPLSRRFLDALSWFGEAVREESPAAQVVKFVTALERMVMTEEKDDIQSVISERIAALCYEHEDPLSRERWRVDAREAYDLRSRLVHGSMSPHDDTPQRRTGLCARLGEATLLNALHSFGKKGLKDDNVSASKLASHYGLIVAHANSN
jgi:hypothetical protein